VKVRVVHDPSLHFFARDVLSPNESRPKMVRAKLLGPVACGAFYLVLLGCGGDVTRQPSAQRDAGGDATAAVSTFDSGAIQDATETLPDVGSAMEAASPDVGSADSSLSESDSGAPPTDEVDASVDDAESSDAESSDASEIQADAHCMSLQISEYDQTCNVDQDCTPALSGDVCDQCNWAAINVSAQEAYGQALRAALGGPIMYPICPGNDTTCCRSGRCAIGASVCGVPDAGTTQPISDASFMPNYTVLCVEDAGAMDSGSAVPGESRWCNGPEQCLQFNGGWQCCVTNFGPVAMCVAR
jgi:hypothetical protein